MISWESILEDNMLLANTSQTFVLLKQLIIELDGSLHFEQEEYDQQRTEYLEEQGYKVLRFWNNDVLKDIESVILVIMNALNDE